MAAALPLRWWAPLLMLFLLTGRSHADAPVATISAPPLYRAGTVVHFSGTAIDDGTPLPASAFTWRVDYHDWNHVHPILAPTSGIQAGSFAVPQEAHGVPLPGRIFHRIHLTVEDAEGLAHTTSVDVLPEVAPMNVGPVGVDSLIGLLIVVDGQQLWMQGLVSIPSVIGSRHTLSVISPQGYAGELYVFDGWTDGGARTHDIITPPGGSSHFTKFRRFPQCQVGSPGQGFRNMPFESQTGSFTVEFDAVPFGPRLNSTIGLSNGRSDRHTDLATIVRFNPSGMIDVRDGDEYSPGFLRYETFVKYRFRVVVDLESQRYTVYVRPGGEREVRLGRFEFRTEQRSVRRLSNLSLWSQASTASEVNVCDFRFLTPRRTCVRADAGEGYQNRSFERHRGAFYAIFDATPSSSQLDGTIGFSIGAQTTDAGFAALVRFNKDGLVDAWNGDRYQYSFNPFPYVAGQEYRFRLLVDLNQNVYTIQVGRPGEQPEVIGIDYAFQTSQTSVPQIDSWAAQASAPGEQLEVCNFGTISVDEPEP